MPPRKPRRNNKRNTRRKSTRNMKRKAYAPKNKKRFIRKSNPIAENKQVEASEISNTVGFNSQGNPILTDLSSEPRYLNTEPDYDGTFEIKNLKTGSTGFPLNSNIFHFNPDSVLYQTHGFDESQMVGRSTYQRMCAAKFLIRWPQAMMNTGHLKYDLDDYPDNTAPLAERQAWISDPNNNLLGVIPSTPQTYYLYWGFIHAKTAYSGYTTPTATTASAIDIENHINHRVNDFFNERTDRLKFIPKTSNSMKIIGKKVLKPPWDRQTGRQPVSSLIEIDDIQDVRDYNGTIPDTLVKIKWPLNRKVHWQPTTNFGSPHHAVDSPTVFYKNWDWLPFAVIVNYNVDRLPKNVVPPQNDASFERDRRVPHVLVNDITYYRDQ